MGSRVRHWIEVVRTGFWFVPVVMLLLSGALALLLLWVDGRVDPGMESKLRWAYSGGPEGARSLLSTIAGSMITAASVTFSLASVALSISSQQYGSRVLRNFMRDTITQVLLGTFLSTFLYSVLVVRTIRGSDFGGGFVPAISVTVAIFLSVLSLVMLVYFVHHISASIQASRIVRVIAENLESAIPHLYPTEETRPGTQTVAEAGWRTGVPAEILSEKSGYLQAVDLRDLLQLATSHDAVIELLPKPGSHLLQGELLARVWGASLNDGQRKRLQHALIIGGERTPEQDIRYTFQQLTDVVIRALSPGINDPFTAINGIDELTSSLLLLARSPRVAALREDDEGVLRLLAPLAGIPEILEETVGHIAIYAAGDSFVMAKLRRVLHVVRLVMNSGEEQGTVDRLDEELDRLEAQKHG